MMVMMVMMLLFMHKLSYLFHSSITDFCPGLMLTQLHLPPFLSLSQQLPITNPARGPTLSETSTDLNQSATFDSSIFYFCSGSKPTI